MKIPFGRQKPSEVQQTTLEKLGFDLKKMVEEDGIYELEIPTDHPYLKAAKCVSSMIDVKYSIFYGDFEVITVNRNVMFASVAFTSVQFSIHDAEVKKAFEADPKTFTGKPYKEANDEGKLITDATEHEEALKEAERRKDCKIM